MLNALEYLKARIAERSTWAAIGVGVTSAMTAPAPWNLVLIGVAVVGAIVPEPKGAE